MNISGILFDLDGVVYIDGQIISGTIETINFLNQHQTPYRFVTNTTTRSRQSLQSKLQSMGLSVSIEHIISAAYAGVLQLRKMGNPCCHFLLQDDAKTEFHEFEENNENPEVVVIGDLDVNWNFDNINTAFNHVLNGAKILALHKGRYFKTKGGLQIDSGAFITAIEYAASTEAIVVGKPTRNFFNLAISDLDVDQNQIIMVGDDIVNDIEGAQKRGMKGVLVKTGKYRKDLVQQSGIIPDLIIDSIASIPELF